MSLTKKDWQIFTQNLGHTAFHLKVKKKSEKWDRIKSNSPTTAGCRCWSSDSLFPPAGRGRPGVIPPSQGGEEGRADPGLVSRGATGSPSGAGKNHNYWETMKMRSTEVIFNTNYNSWHRAACSNFMFHKFDVVLHLAMVLKDKLKLSLIIGMTVMWG